MPTPPKVEAPAQPRPAPTRATMTVMVTDRQGKALEDVEVGVTGPAERDGKTDAEGSVAFRNMGAGTYRLRFEHPEFITLEREVSMVAGRRLQTSAALNPAPSPLPAPKPEPAAPAADTGTAASAARVAAAHLCVHSRCVRSEPHRQECIPNGRRRVRGYGHGHADSTARPADRTHA